MRPLSFTVDPATLPDPPILARCLRLADPDLTAGAVKRALAEGKVWVDGSIVTRPSHGVRLGSRIELRPASPRLDRIPQDEPTIYYHDRHLVVAEKPPGILTLPFGDERDSLAERVRAALARRERHKGALPPLRGVHRLDKLASGVVVIARTELAQQGLKALFEAHDIERIYLARVMGAPRFTTLTRRTFLGADRGDGLKGSVPEGSRGAKEAISHFEVVDRDTRTSLWRCQLETGRTHQLRIHAAELGHPIVGEPVYVRDHAGPWVKSPRLMLHAIRLAFTHPMTGEALSFDSAPPAVMLQEGTAQGPRGR